MITPIRIAIAAAIAQAARSILRHQSAQAGKPPSAWQRMQHDQQRKLYQRYDRMHNRRGWFR